MTMTSSGDEPSTVSEAAQLAVAVLDAEAEREAQQAASQEQVLFADDLLPGVGEEQLSLRSGAAHGRRRARSSCCCCSTSLDELEVGDARRCSLPTSATRSASSNGVIVFLAAASGAFLVLGALPMGWLADRYRRPPIIGWASLGVRGVRRVVRAGRERVPAVLGATRASGSRSRTRCRCTARCSPTRIPIGARGRISASMAMGAPPRRRCSARWSSRASPRSPAATTAGGGRSSSSASRSRWSRCSRSGCRNRREVSSRSRTCSARSSRTRSRRRSRSKRRSPGSGRSARSRP